MFSDNSLIINNSSFFHSVHYMYAVQKAPRLDDQAAIFNF